MAVHFHPLAIKKIKKETPDSVSITFSVPKDLEETYRYKEGQNITIKYRFDGQEIRRSYSICAAPHENELKIAIKKVEGGLFSAYANHELKTGDKLEVLPPTGKFTSRPSARKNGNYLAIAAGSGITPVIGIIKHTLLTEPDSRFTLIYGNRSRGSIIFFEELEGLKNKYIERFNIIHVLSREATDSPLNYGRVNKEKLEALEHLFDFSKFDSIYLCGPEQLIFSASDYLEKKGLDKGKIHFELFTTPGQKPGIQKEKKQVHSGDESKVTIQLDGHSFSFNLPYQGDSILDGALKKGADLPYACKGGVCASCRAKLIKGQVDMAVNYALEEEEIEQGFILTCQSHPRTDEVVVDFDVR